MEHVRDGRAKPRTARDDHVKVQMDAITALSAYAHLGDTGIAEALRQALGDPRHKVQHATEGTLNVPCPRCSEASLPNEQPEQGKGR